MRAMRWGPRAIRGTPCGWLMVHVFLDLILITGGRLTGIPGDAWIQTVSIIQCVYCFMCIPVCYIPDKCKYAHTAYSLHGASLHGASPYGAERSPFPRSEKILSFEKGGFYVLYKNEAIVYSKNVL